MPGVSFPSQRELTLQRSSRSTWREELGVNGNSEAAKDNRDLGHPERCSEASCTTKAAALLTSLFTDRGKTLCKTARRGVTRTKLRFDGNTNGLEEVRGHGSRPGMCLFMLKSSVKTQILPLLQKQH